MGPIRDTDTSHVNYNHINTDITPTRTPTQLHTTCALHLRCDCFCLVDLPPTTENPSTIQSQLPPGLLRSTSNSRALVRLQFLARAGMEEKRLQLLNL